MEKKVKNIDGNEAAAYVAYGFSEVCAIYPITPSSGMAEHVDEWSTQEKKNMFDQTVKVVEMESETGAAGAVHGSLLGGALTSTFTSSQGLLLMIPNIYKWAGELLPAVLHVSARAIATHALSIFGEHSDVMAARQTGCAMLASNNPQEVADLAAVAHLSAIKSRLPFMHFFDGFRTSHEIQKVELMNYQDLRNIVDMNSILEFRKKSLNPERPTLRGSAQNPDINFQIREAANKYYLQAPDIVQRYMDEIYKLTGRRYNLFDYYGDPNADRMIIAMGSVCDTTEETIDYLRSKGEKVGLLKVRLFRPFSVNRFLDAIPKTIKKIAVLDRTKEPGAAGDPLYEEICSAFANVIERPLIIGGRYGLSSKNTTPEQIISVYGNLAASDPKKLFTIGITDDVTNLSLPIESAVNTLPEGTHSFKFWGLASDGTIGANKNTIKIIGEHAGMYVQAYFDYDSKKFGTTTVSHLRFAKTPIRSPYLIDKADLVACHNTSFLGRYDMVKDIKPNGIFLINCDFTKEQLEARLTLEDKKHIVENNISVYVLDAFNLAKEIGLGEKINTIMQSAFFKLANVIPIDGAVKYMKEAAEATYKRKGEKIINANLLAIEKGMQGLKKIEITDATQENKEKANELHDRPTFVKEIMEPINSYNGHVLPVSAFLDMADGTMPQGTTKYEKRGFANNVPEWQIDNCIQCNQCAYICPHTVIRPFLLDENEAKEVPEKFLIKQAAGKGLEKYQYRIQPSILDCTGCGNCADVCPAKEKALIMKPIETQSEQIANWEHAITLSRKENPLGTDTVKGTQFQQPLMEFPSGACAGCGETEYARLVTQLYGERLIIANSTGCSSIWGGNEPTFPYTPNREGIGPAWANSLFEDNAQFGYGIYLGVNQVRSRLRDLAQKLQDTDIEEDFKLALKNWADYMNKAEESIKFSNDIKRLLNTYKGSDANVINMLKEISDKQEFLIKKSVWMFGGDGWAYDIGYGGLDHVLASGEDVNILVFDTEVYSNTGGQTSKSSQRGSLAKFAASGKNTKKKDLGLMGMSYKNVYVAQISMGANQAQTLKAMKEAEAYPGPSLIIAYAPCREQGIKIGMGFQLVEQRKAVEAGYWHLYRYNPLLKEEGKNPFILDSKEPKDSYKEFLMGEVRYASLAQFFPKRAEELFELSYKDAMGRYETYKKLSENNIF